MHALKRIVSKSRGVKRNIEQQLDWQFRRATSKARALPHFIIIGAMKGGTTSLFNYLAQHPQILETQKKEVHYFDNNYDRGEPWYRAHFPLRESIRSGYITGEASPLYLFNPLVAHRIRQLVPNARLIAMLRNPTERAISHYFHEVRRGREPLSLMEALHQEETRMREVVQNRDYQSMTYIHTSYKQRGKYKEQLERYLACFPREHLLLVNSEDFFEKPQDVLSTVFRFIGVDDAFEVGDLHPRNRGRNRTDVDSAVYDYLDAYFAPHNEALYRLLGYRFDW